MADKQFTFVNIATDGRLIVDAPSEKVARESCDLDPTIWIEESQLPPDDNSPLPDAPGTTAP